MQATASAQLHVERLPAAVQHVLVEAADTVRRSRLTVMTAIKHAFSGMFTLEISNALVRQSRSSSKTAPPVGLHLGAGIADDDSLEVAGEAATEASSGYKSLFKSVAATVNWGGSKGVEAVGGGHEARAAQLLSADSGLDSAALDQLLEIINREFQVWRAAPSGVPAGHRGGPRPGCAGAVPSHSDPEIHRYMHLCHRPTDPARTCAWLCIPHACLLPLPA